MRFGLRIRAIILALMVTQPVHASVAHPTPRGIQAAALSNADTLQTAIQSGSLMIQFIWRLNRLAGTIENFDWTGTSQADRQRQSKELASILRSDQEMALDTYMKLIEEIAAYPDPPEASRQIAATQKEFEMTGHVYMRFFLQLLADHVDRVRRAETPSRDQILSDIFARTAKPSQ
jgi:hypothetical protein